MTQKERIERLEKAVKHLIQIYMDREHLSDPGSRITLEEVARRDERHKKAFKEFLGG